MPFARADVGRDTISSAGNAAEHASAAANPRATAAVDHWKRRLLDLTKRNRALNFKFSRTSTLTFSGAAPDHVFRFLLGDRQSMRFQADGDAPDLVVTDAEQLEETGAGHLDSDGQMPGQTQLDNLLRVRATREVLDRVLRRMDEQAKATLEEQGVNTLFLGLGMLRYRDSDDSDEWYLAPLILLPVELDRKSARAGFQVACTDDDPLINPGLVEYLRRGFGISLPRLPESDVLPDDFDVRAYFEDVSREISHRNGWCLQDDVVLGLFAFQKLVMYRDLEANLAAISGHALIEQLLNRSGETIVGLPSDIRDLDLDQQYPPESTFQIVDADSSQLRAIAAVSKGHSLVLEGPPGTGKSQTITNLVAQALGSGKSVLFVAEKMAALEVVHQRLSQAGLGEFCLELHSTKANKRAVVQNIAAALDASLEVSRATPVEKGRLATVRAELAAYPRAVHEPLGSLGIPPYQAYGELDQVIGAPRLKLDRVIDSVGIQDFNQAIRDLKDLAITAQEIGEPASHPWRDATKTFYAAGEVDVICDDALGLAGKLLDLVVRALDVAQAFGLPPIRSHADIQLAGEVAKMLAQSPGAPLAVLENSAWNAAPPDALAIVEQGKRVVDLSAQVLAKMQAEVLGIDHSSDVAFVEQKCSGPGRWLAFLDRRYRQIRRRWKAYRLPGFQPSLSEQAKLLAVANQVRLERDALGKTDGAALFGALWQGAESDWAILERYIAWVVSFRKLCVKAGLESHGLLEVAAKVEPDVQAVAALRDRAAELEQTLERLRQAIGWPSGYLADAPFEEVAGRLDALGRSPAQAPRWAAFEAARARAAVGVAADAIVAAMKGEVPFDRLVEAFKRAFHQAWLSNAVQVRPPLQAFQTLAHEQRIAEFRDLDQRILRDNRASLVGRLRSQVQERLQEERTRAQLPYLRGQMARQRKLAPLRKTMREAYDAIRAIKPCFLMSPLSVAQYLEGAEPSFDLVIFDEASQLPAEDAVGAIIRGKQLVVVGDPKQLPPTNFFSVATDSEEASESGLEDSESILEDFEAAGLPMARLRWHYRSAHESLVTFSNLSFYDGDLYTFPCGEVKCEGVQFEFVEDGWYEGAGLNQAEARRVADAVVHHAKTTPGVSLGVGTFNQRQQMAILDVLEARRRQDPTLEAFFSRSNAEPFFVKNLENIQGDERDVIFLSVTYARAADGRLRYNFGPLNGANGWRRLNVITTRAKRGMRVFSSIRGDDIELAATASDGPRLLKDFLNFAERGQLDRTFVSKAADTESPFERAVFTELSRRGLTVVPQVGVAGYRIDLAVIDDANPGRYVCGIECDGAAYHSSETARDRDRLRQKVLEDRGWQLIRVWSTDWFKDRSGQIERVLARIEKAKADAVRNQSEGEVPRRPDSQPTPPWHEEVVEEARQERAAQTQEPDLPVAFPYQRAGGEGRYLGRDILVEPLWSLEGAILEVVGIESPIHEEELASRVAAMWGKRLGTRIRAKVQEALRLTIQGAKVERRGGFLWKSGGTAAARCRTEFKMAADRIAPEEYQEAVLVVLGVENAFDAKELKTRARSLLGFSRTGPEIDAALDEAVAALLSAGNLGESSAGLKRRV